MRERRVPPALSGQGTWGQGRTTEPTSPGYRTAVLRRRPERWPARSSCCETRRPRRSEGARTQNGAGVATGPVSGSGRGLSTPVGSQSDSAGASSNRVRSGTAEASSEPSLQAFTGQAPLPPVGRLSGKPATILTGILPATRRLSVLRPFFHRANPASRPSVPLRANPSNLLRSPIEQALRAAFRGSLARRLRFRRTPEKWVRLRVSPLPRASSRLPHQSVPGLLPEGSRPDRHWRRPGVPRRFRQALLDRERPTWPPGPSRAKPNLGHRACG